MKHLRITYPKRGSDDWGSGAFAASRGGRLHLGRDYLCAAGSTIRAPMEGRIVRIGHPYSDDLSFRLIELLSGRVLWRFFYVAPAIIENQWVSMGTVIGHSQNISARYVRGDREKMPNHVHVECIVDPEAFFELIESISEGGAEEWA